MNNLLHIAKIQKGAERLYYIWMLLYLMVDIDNPIGDQDYQNNNFVFFTDGLFY